MRKIVNYLAAALTAITLFASCEKEDEAVKKLEMIPGTYSGTMTAVKGETEIYKQTEVTIQLSEAGGNYMDMQIGGEYKDLNDVILQKELRLAAVKNYDGIYYRTFARLRLNTIPRTVPIIVRKIDGKVILNITFDDAKPYTIVEFKEN